MSLEILDEAAVKAIATACVNAAIGSISILDERGIVDGIPGETVTLQEHLTALSDCAYESATLQFFTTAGSRIVNINGLPAGFTTADIIEIELENVSSTVQLAVLEQQNDTGSALNLVLSGIESVTNGHEINVHFLKSKF